MKIKENDIKEALTHYRALEKAQGEIPVNEELARHIRTAIAALEFCLKHRWIPVTERLPDNEDDVLVTASGYMKYLGYEAWEIYNDDGEVTAWMTAPDPYDIVLMSAKEEDDTDSFMGGVADDQQMQWMR